jgi:hypothetical protein
VWAHGNYPTIEQFHAIVRHVSIMRWYSSTVKRRTGAGGTSTVPDVVSALVDMIRDPPHTLQYSLRSVETRAFDRLAAQRALHRVGLT